MGIYSRAFFCNTDLDKELFLRIVKDRAEELEAETYESDGELLREVHKLLQQRALCFGSSDMPACLPEEVVWVCFRGALMNVEYWLSIQEIQLIAAYVGARLHVYVCNEDSL